MDSIDIKVSTPWKNNSTEDAHEIIKKNLNELRKKAVQIALKGDEPKAYLPLREYSVAEIYGFWANKKRIVTYATVEFF